MGRRTRRAVSALQLDVIQRLRERGHVALAEEAREAWIAGLCLENEYLGGDQLLRADSNRANAETKT